MLGDLTKDWEFHNRTEGKATKTIARHNSALGQSERFLAASGASTRQP